MNLVACGWRHTIAVADSGNLYTFGWSKYGQLGHGDFEDHLVPFQVQALKSKSIQAVSPPSHCPFREILVTDFVTLHSITSSTFRCYSLATSSMIINTTHKAVFISNQVAGGWRHTVALDEDGQLYGWGWNKVTSVVFKSLLNLIYN